MVEVKNAKLKDTLSVPLKKELIPEVFQNLLSKWSCIVRKVPITIDVLINKIEKGHAGISGGIVLDADFQRAHKWTTKKASSIIESILLGIPIPTVYLSQNTMNDTVLFNIIDGQHRLYSIESFIKGKYRLNGLTKLPELNGKKYSQLPNFLKNRLLYDSQIDISSIDISENEELEYEIFLRFNQETNPLTKQELLDVLYRSDYATWFRNELIPELATDDAFNTMFNNTGKRLKDRTLNYSVYACLGYAYTGLIEGKNDSPIYVGQFMKAMMYVKDSQLDEAKRQTKEYLFSFIKFYKKISEQQNIKHIFSKEFLNKKNPQGNHVFLISFLIPLTLIFKYLLEKEIVMEDHRKYYQFYDAIITGMRNAQFGDFGGVSSTSYKTQMKCFNEMQKCIDSILCGTTPILD